MDINFSFANGPQRELYYCTARNQCFSGGFNNGKTVIGCFKVLTLLLTFPNYRVAICRQTYTDLKKTTMETFFKFCPAHLISSHNIQDGITVLKNGSSIVWLHLDKVDSNTLRGLEINSVLVDQAEEMQENVFDVLDARIGRWDGAVVPSYLLEANPNWPINKFGRFIVPSYHILLCNPDNQFHFIYRKFHPDSLEREKDFFYVEGHWDQSLGSSESYNIALRHDDEWINKFIKGQWGNSEAAIHILANESIIDYNEELVEHILEKGNLYRSLDHGDSSPTCCLWWTAIDGVYICYREYYVAARTISFHRRAISDLSGNEEYSGNYADPQIFKKTSQKDGGFWSVSDEYSTRDVEGPALHWIPADNNEFATRNRINELLRPSNRFKHPITNESPAPGIYFIKHDANYPNGCRESFKQLGAQRKLVLGTLNGKTIYSDERDDSVTDHAYDPTRYFIAIHGIQPRKAQKKIPQNTFAYYNAIAERLKYNTAIAASE